MTDSSLTSSHPRLLVRSWRLRDADTGALKVFLKLLASRLQAEWQLSDDGPIDLLVMPVDTVEEPAGSDRPGVVRLRIAVDAAQAVGAPAPVLVRPLQFEDVADLLKAIEPQLIETLGSRRVKAVPQIEPEIALAPKAVPLVSQPETPVQSAPTASAATPAPALPPGTRVKLKRWPDAGQLQGRRGHQRLASQISATALERDDLLSLSGLPEAEVDAFLEAMYRADLLEVIAPQAIPAVAAEGQESVDAEQAPDSLFGLIRRRLGIGS